jgi:predicted nucleotidyltransferase
MNVEKMAQDNKIWEVISGSHAYGTNTPTSDLDTRGLFMADLGLLLSPFEGVEQYMDSKNDTQIYELRKFFHLLADNNPNIIEILWVPSDCVKFKHPAMNLLLAERKAFLSQKVKHTFSGYAMAQMKRIRGHNKWINNPQPESPPALRDYVRIIKNNGIEVEDYQERIRVWLVDYTATKINEHTYKLWHDPECRFPFGFLADAAATNPSYVDIELRRLEEMKLQYVGTAIINVEAYQADIKKWKDYWSWRKNRNEARAQLEAASGFDTKHAMHLVRLLRMAKEILEEGEVKVRRPDAQELLDIRYGKKTYEEIVSYAEEMDAYLESTYKKSSLPHEVDRVMARNLYLEMLSEFWKVKIPV